MNIYIKSKKHLLSLFFCGVVPLCTATDEVSTNHMRTQLIAIINSLNPNDSMEETVVLLCSNESGETVSALLEECSTLLDSEYEDEGGRPSERAAKGRAVIYGLLGEIARYRNGLSDEYRCMEILTQCIYEEKDGSAFGDLIDVLNGHGGDFENYLDPEGDFDDDHAVEEYSDGIYNAYEAECNEFLESVKARARLDMRFAFIAAAVQSAGVDSPEVGPAGKRVR